MDRPTSKRTVKRRSLLNFLFIIFLAFTIQIQANAQSYVSYFTGNTSDTVTYPTGGICLMGGSTENDEAMKWFLQNCQGGDVLVLRASGSDGYNDYMYSNLDVLINSVETIVFKDSTASYNPYIHSKIQNAEAIWMAGGNQWKYTNYWRNTPIDSLINDGIKRRNIAIGGTSAGMAIMGGFYFSAKAGTVTSSTALNDPYHPNITVDSSKFICNEILSDVITDTHYDNRDRKGRHITFLARILKDYGVKAKGIACDETVAVCIAPDGLAKVYGDYPNSENKAYFIQVNPELESPFPESCSRDYPLNWNLEKSSIKAYAVYGTMAGTNSFDLNDWKTGNGGSWEKWHVNKGVLKISTNK